LATKPTNEILINKDSNSVSNSVNACCLSLQNLFSSRLLYNNIKIKIRSNITFRAALYGCETLSVIVREEHGVRVLENGVLRKIFVPGR